MGPAGTALGCLPQPPRSSRAPRAVPQRTGRGVRMPSRGGQPVVPRLGETPLGLHHTPASSGVAPPVPAEPPQSPAGGPFSVSRTKTPRNLRPDTARACGPGTQVAGRADELGNGCPSALELLRRTGSQAPRLPGSRLRGSQPAGRLPLARPPRCLAVRLLESTSHCPRLQAFRQQLCWASENSQNENQNQK